MLESTKNQTIAILPEQSLQAQALTLFDKTTDVHQLPRKARRWLARAAAYYALAQTSDASRKERVARDTVLAEPIPKLSSEEQCVVASTVAFQRDKPRYHRETVFLRLSNKNQNIAMRLAAILQLARHFDESKPHHMEYEIIGKQTIITLAGKITKKQLEKINVDHWANTIGPIDLRLAEKNALADAQSNGMASIETPSLITIDLPSRLPDQLSGDEPFGEGARRVLRRIFEKMLAREEGVRTSDEDPEDVHQMRVATRKLRAALQIVEPVFEPQLIRQYRRDLRRVAQDLGAVRDYDVFLMDVQGVQQTLPEEEQVQLQTFVSAITEERLKRRTGLLEDLQTKRYNRFKQLFATFLTEPGAGVLTSSETGVPPRIRDMAGSMIWRRYEQWRAFEVLLDNGREETLHDARIAGKRLRYTIEFFADALGPRVNQVLEPLIALQDNLGNIQDGAVFQEHIRDLGLAKDAGAQTYLKARLASHDAHLAEYPALWAKVASATYRRNLFGLIVKM